MIDTEPRQPAMRTEYFVIEEDHAQRGKRKQVAEATRNREKSPRSAPFGEVPRETPQT
jgi:hypothetical protein